MLLKLISAGDAIMARNRNRKEGNKIFLIYE